MERDKKGQFIKGGISNMKGKHHSEETKRKLSEFNKGKHHSEITKNKLRKSHLGRKYKPMSEEGKKNISLSASGRIPWNKGKKGLQKHTEEWKQKMSKIMKGHIVSEEIREKMKERMKGKKKKSFKDKHWNWQGGKSFEPYSIDWEETLRMSIRERDRYTCQICNKKQGEITFHIHHIDYNKKNCNPSNLITLCNSCHIKTNFNRKKWEKLFKIKSYSNGLT